MMNSLSWSVKWSPVSPQAHQTLDPRFDENTLTPMRIVDELAAPVRSAIAAVDAPPRLQDYEELTEIGRGGMGVVYRALHKKTQRQDAIKVIRHDRLAGMSSETVKLMQLRFQQESKLAARVAHEHIVPIYQVGEIDERPWFSMQLVDGASLRDLTCDGEIAPERVAGYIESIARAIDVIHRHGIIHGDIKPQNILIERETERPLISDFGLADFEGTFSTDAIIGCCRHASLHGTGNCQRRDPRKVAR